MTKLFLAFLMGILLFLAPLHWVNSAPTDPVDIPDPVLRAAIEKALHKNPGDTITEQDMAGMTRLTADGKDVRDLTGLEYATALTKLNLLGPSISRSVILARPILDMSPLAGLTNLQDIQLQNHRITNITALANLTELETLTLHRTYSVTDISALSGLTKLVYLRASRNDFTDITPIGGLIKLKELDLRVNRRILDFSPLQNLTELRTLWLDHTPMTHEDLSAVLPSLENFDTPTSDRFRNIAADRAGDLGLSGTSVSDLSVLSELPNDMFLSTLRLAFMGTSSRGTLFFLLTDITPLVELMNAGKVIDSGTHIDLRWNFRLDYPSLYTDLPALLAGSDQTRPVLYFPSTPSLEKESPTDEPYRGHPGTRHTFVVRAINDTPYSNYPLERTQNRTFNGVPVTWTVTAPDGTVEETGPVLTGDDGLARVTITLGNDGETHTVAAVVPANRPAMGPQHDELRVEFTAIADSTVPPPQPPTTDPDRTASDGPTVTFEDYPTEKPSDGFTLTIKFSEPVTGFEKADIIVETEHKTGTGGATLKALTPSTAPTQRYTATIGVPAHATGTVHLIVQAQAALGSISGEVGPATQTRSEPIAFGRSKVSPFASKVAMEVIFNEIRNASDDKNDWIELKNITDEAIELTDYAMSIVIQAAPKMVRNPADVGEADVDIVRFPEGYTLPAAGILLIVNTPPSETDLIEGQEITDAESDPDMPPQYLIASEMKLPHVPYMLILRSAMDKNGKPEAFEDLAGTYFRGFADYGTQVWPLVHTLRPTEGKAAVLTQGQAWQRERIAIKQRGYTQAAWALSGHRSGIGYKRGTSLETSLGTPGYPNDSVADDSLVGRITFSEMMYATRGGLLSQPQWIELYNNTDTAALPINLNGWQLVVEARESESRHRYSVIKLREDLYIAPGRTVLLVTRDLRHSGHLTEGQVYSLFRHHGSHLKLGLRENTFLPAEGFGLRLLSPTGTLVDSAGNLDGKKGKDTPTWELPSEYTTAGERTSLLRRYEDDGALVGTESRSWVRAADVALPLELYYGHETDIGSPGYREGGIAPVMLSQFRASRGEGGVIVDWSTVSETHTAGFNILRCQRQTGRFVKVNPVLILGAGTTGDKQHYTYKDLTAQANTVYYYRLEEVSLSGERRALTTVRLRGHVSVANKLLWKWADVKYPD